jgi:hypothetical protein
MRGKRQLKRNLRQLLRAERRKGSISRREYNRASLGLIVHMSEIEEFVVDQAVCDEKLTPQEAEATFKIDWDALLEWLTEILPVILEFIMMLLTIFVEKAVIRIEKRGVDVVGFIATHLIQSDGEDE